MKSATTVTSISQFKPIKLSDLRGNVTDFDLYIDIAGRAVLYAPGPYQWSESEKERLVTDGHVVLFYEPNAAEAVQRYLNGKPQTAESSDPESTATIDAASEISSEFCKQLYSLPIIPESELPFVKNLSQNIQKQISEHPLSTKRLGKLRVHDTFSFYHSARVAAYAAAIAYKMSLSSEQALIDIALGAILHDLGHIKVEPEILDKEGKLNEREWSVIKQHPEWGYEMIEGFDVGFVTSEIILHHHEREDGLGYPHGISGKELLQEVKIVTFADVFDALSSRRPYQDQKSLSESLDFIEQIAMDYLDREAFKAMREIVSNINQSKLSKPA